MIYLIRHADAGGRLIAGDDRFRELTDAGHAQAAALAGALPTVTRIVLSPAARCIQTMTPTAELSNLGLETDHHLFEGSEPTRALELLGELADHDAAVICSHGDVIGDTLRLLAIRGVQLDGPMGCGLAGRWALDLDDNLQGTATYMRLPA